MFIYAVVRAMSLRVGVPMYFNIHTGFEFDKLYKRKLELINFKLTLPTARLCTFDYPYGDRFRALSKRLGFNALMPWQRFISEKDFNVFVKDIVDDPCRDAYLDGLFQNVRYFSDCRDVIRDDFQITAPIAESVRRELAYINSLGRVPVMIGIRRYEECKTISDYQKTQPEYILKAVEVIKSRVESPVFVVFSQDYEWARKNVQIPGSPVYFVKPKTGPLATIEDFWLMTKCHHYIISRSSYHWWAAWLSENKLGKMVILPEGFAKRVGVCEGWIVI